MSTHTSYERGTSNWSEDILQLTILFRVKISMHQAFSLWYQFVIHDRARTPGSFSEPWSLLSTGLNLWSSKSLKPSAFCYHVDKSEQEKKLVNTISLLPPWWILWCSHTMVICNLYMALAQVPSERASAFPSGFHNQICSRSLAAILHALRKPTCDLVTQLPDEVDFVKYEVIHTRVYHLLRGFIGSHDLRTCQSWCCCFLGKFKQKQRFTKEISPWSEDLRGGRLQDRWHRWRYILTYP